MGGIRVLVVEDDLRLADALAGALRSRGYDVSLAATGAAALAAPPCDVILLDLGLPDYDGVELCRELRQRFDTADVGIIMVTARSQERERVLGLRSGADDYVVKPASLEELSARIEAVLRRRPHPVARVLNAGGLSVDLARRTVHAGDEELTLRPKEFDLLAVIMRDPGTVATHEQLLLQVWQTSWSGNRHTLEVHIGTLRAKLPRAELIETVRGVGYRFAAGEEAPED